MQQPFKTEKQPYIIVLSAILAAVIVFYSFRALYMQVIHPEAFGGDDGYRTFTTTIPAARGEILDCQGRKIAVNRDGYDIVFNYSATDLKTINELIERLINLLGETGTEYIDDLPLKKEAPYDFDTEQNTDRLKKFLEVADYATAGDCFTRLVEKFGLEEYSAERQRKIMGVRYTMSSAGFSLSAPYTFAEDISDELMLKISELGYAKEGVTVQISPYREYAVSTLAPHLIGSVGPIYKEDWEEYKEKGYSYNDKVGKSGIELYAEEYLRGTDGEMTYKIDAMGNIVSSKVTKAPVTGKTVMLTLDKTLQMSAQQSLEKYIKELRTTNPSVTGGAIVAMNIKNGSVLVSANYPSYDMATLSKNYSDLADKTKNPDTPLLDRAFTGVYPVGSTIKPAVAVAALEKGKYNRGETIFCKHTYTYFDDHKPQCMHYHGSMNLKSALAKSCNYFFFELGRRTGIKTLNEYFRAFGLGVKTGIEVNDSTGILTDFEYDSGNTLQAAIGQLNAFTPLQLANYTCTLVNGGTRYKATLIEKVVEADFSKTVLKNEAKVENSIKINSSTLDAVKEGMLSVTEDGTGSTVFGK
ncbi:MAG: penicillin-binding protein [Clostridiales bacterium]|nr:penicillin-binding protein [Candidatus Equinaster intestinalis]